MRAMVLPGAGQPLEWQERPRPSPAAGEVRLRVLACAVCRTDLHIVDGDLLLPLQPIVPGHEIVGTVEAVGAGVENHRVGDRVGVPWLGHTCGHCAYCGSGSENLCDTPRFTGFHRDGGFASHVIAEADFCLPLDGLGQDPAHLAPLMCAGLIGWRSLKAAGHDARRLGLYGFGAAAHLIAQVAVA
ncbi:MAG: alcohol dehydrogenase catalytic domain-containing protein, partial [Gammaproteobacteria bacterium]|nr:alcohol dehydrogenase catalytic domain-containing protein [Gammaproteobacteria bacterium]